MFRLEFHNDSSKRRDGRGRGNSSGHGGRGGRGRGGGRGTSGRLPNRPPRNDSDGWWDGRGRGGGRGRGRGSQANGPRPPHRRPNPELEEPKIKEVQMEDIICHTFLPKKLPENAQEHLVDVEERLFDCVLSGISDSIKDTDGFAQLEASKSMIQRWKESQPKWRSDADEEHFAIALHDQIANQKEGETIPIYVRKQNCTMLITKLDENISHLCTFRTMMRSETVMSAVGSVTMSFPQTCDEFYNNDILLSDIYLYHLHQLSVDTYELSYPKIKKGETSYTDYREVPEPDLIASFMAGILVPANHTIPLENGKLPFGCVEIKKKMRDQVNCQMSARANSFRRSGLWTALKVALQLKLVQDIGDSKNALVVYKLIMLRTLAGICQQYSKDCANIDLDLGSQLIAKLGRRVSKLKEMPISQEDGDEHAEKILLLKEKSLEYCQLVVGSVRADMTRLWRHDASTHSVIPPIVRSADDFRKDLDLQILWLDEHIRQALPVMHNVAARAKQIHTQNMQKADALKKCVDFQRSLQAKRYTSLDAILKYQNAFNSQFSDIDDINERIWIYDTEYYIKHKLDLNEVVEDGEAEKIQNLIVAYFKNAVPRFTSKNDPVCYSQMILVILKSLHWMDKRCTEKYPLLTKYKSGIKTELFDRLHLSHRQDILLLDEISDYFNSRDDQAEFPSLIERNTPKADSLPVRFAEENEFMRQIHQNIQRNTEVAEKAKITEVKKVKAECELLDRELMARGGICKAKDQEDGEIHDNKQGSRNFEAITCKRCKIKSILRMKRRSVKIYERPLPVEEYLQYAVIFELKIPPDICLLRDMLALLNFEILGEPIFRGQQKKRNVSSKPPPVEDWRGYMRRQGPSDDYKPHNTSAISSIDFVSPRIATSGTCNAKLQNPDVLVASLEDFVVDNDLDCVYYHEKPLWFPIIKNAADACTFQLHSTCQPDAFFYETLQWTVGGTTHCQNQVIARSNDHCNRQLTPEEYSAFGSIRADSDRIQMWNLYRAIYDRSLSLQKEPVLALIFQVVWQVGPRNENGDREFQQDFLNSEFCLEFLKMLDELVETCEGNYSEPLILMGAVVITVRILEMNRDACKEMCYNLLKKSRNIVDRWMEKIEENLVTSAGRDDGKSVDFLKARQLEATLCSMFSYNVSDENLVEILFQSEEDYVHWFHAISRLHQLTEQEQCHKSISHFAQILLNNARNIPLKLELHKNLKSAKAKDVMLKSLHHFSLDRWSKVADCIHNTTTWRIFSEKENPHLLFGGYEETQSSSKVKIQHFLSMDLLIGSFLVNGFPQNTLPAVILAHPLYKRYFKDSKFRIQRYSTCARTIDKFHGRYYDFEMIVKQGNDKGKFELGSLIIREIQEEESGRQRVLEMIEPVLFRQVVGSSFAENYTHWLDTEKKVVYFRRLPKQDSDYNLPHDYALRRDDHGYWKFYDERQRKYLLSIHSDGFKWITAALARLESKEEINVLLEIVTGFVTAKLPRYNLSFNLVGTKLHSEEYTDFCISENQNMGTLIGLQHGLLLELGENPDKYSKRILIVPHGYLESCVLNLKHHHNTIIDLGHLRQPRFFVYDYDTVLRQLKADKSQPSWLYLAALHATTSSSLPDPFTEVTGTERCMEILQSGRVWPSQPYCSESLGTLRIIRNLAPRRSYYGHGISFMDDPEKRKKSPGENMEITQWCEVIPSMAAYDGYPLIVDKLIQNSGRILELHGHKISPQKIQQLQHKNDIRETVEEAEKLQLRSYRRHLSLYNQAAVVAPEFVKKSCQEMLGTVLSKHSTYKVRSEGSFCLRELQIVAQTRLVNTFEKRSLQQWQNSQCDLETYLLTSAPVAPLYQHATCPSSMEGLPLKDLLNMEFEINWLQLYAWAINKNCGKSPAFTMILSALAFRGAANLQHIMHLHHISILAEKDEFPEVPTILHAFPKEKSVQPLGPAGEPGPNTPEDTADNDEDVIIPVESVYEPEEIQTILESNMIPLDALGEEGPGLEKHMDNVRADATRIAEALRDYWPCPNIPTSNQRVSDLFKDSNIRFRDAMIAINLKIGNWYRNLAFNQFVIDVQSKLNAVLKERFEKREMQESHELYQKFDFSYFREKSLQIGVSIDGVQPLKLPEMMVNLRNLDEARVIFQSGQWLSAEDREGKDFAQQRNLYAVKITEMMGEISENVRGGRDGEIDKKILYESGVAPRITSTMLLQYLLDPKLKRENNPLWIYVGALGVLWTHLKRLNRCIAFQKKGESAISDLRKEEENLGHDEWSPIDHPEWLLLELELDIMIRRKQVRVARRMMAMRDKGNGVMQLNMGEGKTSVIVPMLCAALASDDALCRVTVLSSIFKTNLNILRFAIGGLLNRRVYTFPCRRSVELDVGKAAQLLDCLKECLAVKGVFLTVPEHRLSFRLLALDKIKKGDCELGGRLLYIENWLRYYCRDILDESDELLNVKYQLVYTTGTQNDIDGESLRWSTCQKILDAAKRVAGELQDKYNNDNDCIEFDKDKQAESPERFTTLRLLRDDCWDEFKEKIADHMLTDLRLDGVQRLLAGLFMTQEMISEENHQSLVRGLQDKPELLNKVLLVSAYLRRSVLSVALRKRWRVEYGVNPVGERLMAVPFRAKDVAAERNEFGHPDLAIVLTHLSYYYSGLNDDQLRDCFQMLKRKRGGEEIYDDWVRQMRPEAVPPNLHLFQRINLVDTEQTDVLFKIFKRHESVIDFWLSRKVFPRESKVFSGKITMTGWDLCHGRNRHPITGFSGTNDSQDLLPLTTKQQDLDELRTTNTDVENALLQPQNNEGHKGFSMGVTCADILTQMKRDSLRILIDAGALMLDCDNEQVAKLWLDSDPDIEAIVYFGKDGEEMVKCQSENNRDANRIIMDVRLEESPFKYNLERCAVFLDDQHTRGVDLKFPDGSRACVTVGSKMKREKLVQACLRMRKLLTGEHSVTFYLSHEAHSKVNGKAVEIDTDDIIEWVQQNTTAFNRDGLLYLSINGLNYAQKLVAEDYLNFPTHLTPLNSSSFKSDAVLKIMAEQCSNDEITILLEMYGMYAKNKRLVEVIPIWFEMTRNRLVDLIGQRSPIPGAVMANFERVKDELVDRCEEICPDKSVLSSCGAHAMEEEQEKELEKEKEKETEVEEEREVQRPPPPEHYTPDLHDNVKFAILNGDDQALSKKPGLLLLSEIFENTTFWKDVQPDCWSKHVYATEDFAKCIKVDGVYSSTNLYLRPIHWVASLKSHPGEEDGVIKLLVLSPFEVNEMMPCWRNKEAVMQLHSVCRRRFQNQDLLLNKRGLQLGKEEYVEISESSVALEALSVANGNLYFGSEEERLAYRRFLEVGEREVDKEKANFRKDPTQMVKQILSCRHPVLSEVSHVIRLLDGDQ